MNDTTSVPRVTDPRQDCTLHPDCGVVVLAPGTHRLVCESDRLCYLKSGRAIYRTQDETLELEPDTVVHFKTGTRGEGEVTETAVFTYMNCAGSPAARTPVLKNARTVPAEKDWGVIPTMLEGESLTSGIVLSREPDGRAESGVWICTPGTWACHVTSDEYCHFLEGRCTYTHESGEVIEIVPDTLAFFAKDWRGTCRVHETVRKVYLIR